MKYFLGIDIGTYESKGVLMNESASLAASATCPHVMETPKPGYAEHDAIGVWWHDFCEISRSLIAEAHIDPKDIACVGVSGIAPCCLPVDQDLNPLCKAILYGVDTRAETENEQLNRELGEDYILERYGSPLTSQSAGTKILWLKHNEPEVWAKTDKFLTCSSFLAAKLTGVCAIDRYTASTFIPLYNLEHQNWEDDLRGICRRDQLAECYWTNEIIGHVTPEAAAQTGLCAGTPVTTGTADAAAEGFSAGVMNPGDLMLMYGSSLFMIHVVDRLLKDPCLWAGPFLFEGTYAVAAGMSCGGTITRWFRNQIAPDIAAKAEFEGKNPYTLLTELTEGIPAGSDGVIVLPYFSGERTPINDPKAKGIIYGLNLLHTRGHIYKAILEGIGYGINQHFELFRQRGISTKRVMAVGGGVKSKVWLQAVSDICNREQTTVEIETGASYGDALLAALAVGFFASREDVQRVIRERNVIYPDAIAHEQYLAPYGRYCKLYQATKEIMHEH